MRAWVAYLAGAGTMVVASAIGLGGGLITGNILTPASPGQAPQTSRLERGAAVEAAAAVAAAVPIRAAASGPERMQAPDPVPYLAETERAGFGAVFASSGPQTAANVAQPSARATVANDSRAADTVAAQPGESTEQQASRELASSPEDAYAKAKDSDVRREAAEHRRAQRRQRWAERRRQDRRGEAREPAYWGDVPRFRSFGDNN